MILWNGMWHGLRNDIIMWNLICGKWRKEKNSTGKYVRVSAALFFCANSSEQSICWSIYCKAKIETQLIHELLDKSSITRFQNKLKRFFTHVSFPVKRIKYENMSSLNSLLLSFYSPHYIEKPRNGGRGKIERKREDPGIEAVRKWQSR